MAKHKKKIIPALIIVVLLVISFFMGDGNSKKNDVPVSSVTAEKSEEPAIQSKNSPVKKSEKKKVKPKEAAAEEAEKPDDTTEIVVEQDKETQEVIDVTDSATVIQSIEEKDENNQENGAQDKPKPVDPDDAVISTERLTCTLSVRCDTAVEKNSDKSKIIPQDGIIMEEREVSFYRGESVFNVLLREMKLNKIHMEFVSVPLYNSAYIEGIANLYEFDCGELSGWMYKVNDWFPNYGSSRYLLKQGDKIEILYTCDLGKDVGGEYSPRNGR